MEAAVVVVVVDVVVAKLEVRVADKKVEVAAFHHQQKWKLQLVAAVGVQGLVFTSCRGGSSCGSSCQTAVWAPEAK